MFSSPVRLVVFAETVAATDTRSAVPNDAATWFMVLPVDCACWMASLGSEFTPHVFTGVMVNCMPMAMTA